MKRDDQTVRVGSRVGREKNIKNMGKNTSIKIRVPCSDRHAWFDGKIAALTHMKSLVKDLIEQLSSVISSTYEKAQ